ncbi:MAG: CDP-alcohol phosphatidyltransferase family protein [Patescibacteria group bacterium]
MAKFFDQAVRRSLFASIPGWIHPNHLSICRALLLAPLLAFRTDVVLAIGIVLLSSICDLLDGPLARLRGIASKTGAVLDAFSDKIFLNGALFFACSHAIPAEIRWTALGFDIALTLVRPIKSRYGLSVHANRWGGAKAWAMTFGICFALTQHVDIQPLAAPAYLLAICFAILDLGNHVVDVVRKPA